MSYYWVVSMHSGFMASFPTHHFASQHAKALSALTGVPHRVVMRSKSSPERYKV